MIYIISAILIFGAWVSSVKETPKEKEKNDWKYGVVFELLINKEQKMKVTTSIALICAVIALGVLIKAQNDSYARAKQFAQECENKNGVLSSVQTGFFHASVICSENGMASTTK